MEILLLITSLMNLVFFILLAKILIKEKYFSFLAFTIVLALVPLLGWMWLSWVYFSIRSIDKKYKN